MIRLPELDPDYLNSRGSYHGSVKRHQAKHGEREREAKIKDEVELCRARIALDRWAREQGQR